MKMTSLVLAVSVAVLLSACGKEESAAPEATAPAGPEAAAPAPAASAPAAEEKSEEEKPEVEVSDLGKKVFGSTCSMCHAAGVAGAPKPGDKTDWGPRIAQGKDTLYKHALEGFTGAKGQMPARGGSATLKDEEVKAAVDYMVAQSQ